MSGLGRGDDSLAEMLEQQCRVEPGRTTPRRPLRAQLPTTSTSDTQVLSGLGGLGLGQMGGMDVGMDAEMGAPAAPPSGGFLGQRHPGSAFSAWPTDMSQGARSDAVGRAPRTMQAHGASGGGAWGMESGLGSDRAWSGGFEQPQPTTAYGSRNTFANGAPTWAGSGDASAGTADGGPHTTGSGFDLGDFDVTLPLSGLEITSAPQPTSGIYAERTLCELLAATEAGKLPAGTHGINLLRSMLGQMLWCCNECDRWAEDDGYAARAVVTDMRAAAIALQVQLHRRLWPMCGEWQTTFREMCAEHGPEILSQIGAPPIERWPTTVVERDRVVGELEEATSEAAMASVWAGSEAESEALGRIEWLLAPGEVNWVEQTPANPGRITEFTSELRRGKLLEIWVQIHRHDHPECRANEVGFKALPGWGPALCIHSPKMVDPRSTNPLGSR